MLRLDHPSLKRVVFDNCFIISNCSEAAVFVLRWSAFSSALHYIVCCFVSIYSADEMVRASVQRSLVDRVRAADWLSDVSSGQPVVLHGSLHHYDQPIACFIPDRSATGSRQYIDDRTGMLRSLRRLVGLNCVAIPLGSIRCRLAASVYCFRTFFGTRTVHSSRIFSCVLSNTAQIICLSYMQRRKIKFLWTTVWLGSRRFLGCCLF